LSDTASKEDFFASFLDLLLPKAKSTSLNTFGGGFAAFIFSSF